MTSTTHNEAVRKLGTTNARMYALSIGHRNFNGDDTRQSPPKLHPGAAITFSIAAVIAVLSFIEVVFS
jgi:hypothetical protein